MRPSKASARRIGLRMDWPFRGPGPREAIARRRAGLRRTRRARLCRASGTVERRGARRCARSVWAAPRAQGWIPRPAASSEAPAWQPWQQGVGAARGRERRQCAGTETGSARINRTHPAVGRSLSPCDAARCSPVILAEPIVGLKRLSLANKGRRGWGGEAGAGPGRKAGAGSQGETGARGRGGAARRGSRGLRLGGPSRRRAASLRTRRGPDPHGGPRGAR